MSKTDPTHYTLPDGTQVYDITRHFDFTVGNCIKYLMRAGNKKDESTLDDLRKCRWYLNKLIEREENDAKPKREAASITDTVRLSPPSIHTSVCNWTD